MTVITAVKKDNEIAIACDTLVTRNGNIKTLAEHQANCSKLIPYGDSIFGFTGSWAVKQILQIY